MNREPIGERLAFSLLIIGIFELLTYRLAAPVLRPMGDATPGVGHEILENVGLFGFHLSSILSPVVLVLLVARRDSFKRSRTVPLAIAVVVLAALGVLAQLLSPAPSGLQLALYISYGAALLAIVVPHVLSRGDLGVRIGLGLVALPLLVHAYGLLALRMSGEEAMFTGLPERLTAVGHWTLIVAASTAPYCFSPRPFARAAKRPAPLFVGAFVGLVAAVIVRKNFEVGAALASYGLGIQLGAGIPEHMIALALLGLGTLSWTLLSCFLAPSPARRRVGLGLALILVAGYGFHWPMQYSLSAVGLVLIARAGRVVAGEEEADRQLGEGYFRAPPVMAKAWQAFVDGLSTALTARGARDVSVETHTTDVGSRTILEATIDELPVSLGIDFDDDSIDHLVLVIGGAPEGEPSWTLSTRPERRLGRHPNPPKCNGSAVTTRDAPFDRRFLLHDASELTGVLLDEDLRARATAIVDGWLAFWKERGMTFCVYPGRGAPLDHPIPITELAFRAGETEVACDRLLTLIQLLVEITSRGLATDTT